jgi:hypothetical protein
MQPCLIFVTALNITTNGFFWWSLPTFISRFHESITDLESNSGIDLDRMPQLKIKWPHQALKEDLLLQHMPIVFGFVAMADDLQRDAYSRYFRALAIMAKNDIFYQFEHILVDEFISSLEMALQAYGDWNGDMSGFDACVAALFANLNESEQFLGMIAEQRALALSVRERRIARPVTLEDVVKAKILFDTYILLKAILRVQEEIRMADVAKTKSQPEGVTNESAIG